MTNFLPRFKKAWFILELRSAWLDVLIALYSDVSGLSLWGLISSVSRKFGIVDNLSCEPPTLVLFVLLLVVLNPLLSSLVSMVLIETNKELSSGREINNVIYNASLLSLSSAFGRCTAWWCQLAWSDTMISAEA